MKLSNTMNKQKQDGKFKAVAVVICFVIAMMATGYFTVTVINHLL